MIVTCDMCCDMRDKDGDGFVSQEDYRLARRFDVDGNGVIDPQEKARGKKMLATEFFNAHKDHLHIFGDDIKHLSVEENIEALSKSYHFEKTFKDLNNIGANAKARQAQHMKDCIGISPNVKIFETENSQFNLNKQNVSPTILSMASASGRDVQTVTSDLLRNQSLLSPINSSLHLHAGSREQMLAGRRCQARLWCDNNIQQANASGYSPMNTRRMRLISNLDLENS